MPKRVGPFISISFFPLANSNVFFFTRKQTKYLIKNRNTLDYIKFLKKSL